MDYLRKMASHKLVFQLDVGNGSGRVAGDALLCRIPCVGGNGVTERLIFPDFTSQHTSAPDLLYAVVDPRVRLE